MIIFYFGKSFILTSENWTENFTEELYLHLSLHMYTHFFSHSHSSIYKYMCILSLQIKIELLIYTGGD